MQHHADQLSCTKESWMNPIWISTVWETSHGMCSQGQTDGGNRFCIHSLLAFWQQHWQFTLRAGFAQWVILDWPLALNHLHDRMQLSTGWTFRVASEARAAVGAKGWEKRRTVATTSSGNTPSQKSEWRTAVKDSSNGWNTCPFEPLTQEKTTEECNLHYK